MMDLFEIAEERAGKIIDEIEERLGNPPYDPATDATSGIHAMAKALKEMMVGEPKKGAIRHRAWFVNTELSTDIDMAHLVGNPILAWHLEKFGTDGEEVVIMVLKVS